MKTIVNVILKYSRLFILFVVFITAFLSLRINRVEMKEDEETFIARDNPVLKEYHDFLETFESNTGVVVAFESGNLFSADEIRYISELEAKLNKLPGVIKTTSLISADNINGVEWGIEIFPLFDTDDLSEEKLKAAREQIDGNPYFEGVFISEDHRVTALIIDLPGTFNGGSDSLHRAFFSELSKLISEEEDRTGRRLYAGGDIVTDSSIEELMDRDLSLFFPLALLLSAVILFVTYRKLITTIVPLIPILLAILWLLGLKGWTGIPLTPISITLFPLIMVIGLANSIHIINHYKKIRYAEPDRKQALIRTLRAVLKPCFLAAFTTAVGFGSLYVSDVVGIKQMGLFAAFGIMSAFLLSVLIVPFGLLHSKVFEKEPPAGLRRNVLTPVLSWIDGRNQRSPWLIVGIFAVIALIMACFIPQIEVEGSMATFARENTRVRQDIRFLDERMSGINAYELILRGNGNCFRDPAHLDAMESFTNDISQDPSVLKSFSMADLVKSLNKALHNDDSAYDRIPPDTTAIAQYLFLYEASGGEDLSSFVNENYSLARITIRTAQLSDKEQKQFITVLNDKASAYFPGIGFGITGSGKLLSHVNENLISTQVESILLAFGIILLLMFIMFGVRGGLLSLFPNLFPVVFFMGLMGIFGIDLNMATSIIGAVTIGIVVDDTVHFFFGYKKEMLAINNPRKAISLTIEKVGAALCITSLILTLGFGILVFSASKFIGDFGIMSASAIASALLGDLFISPIVLSKSKLFYKRNNPQKQ